MAKDEPGVPSPTFEEWNRHHETVMEMIKQAKERGKRRRGAVSEVSEQERADMAKKELELARIMEEEDEKVRRFLQLLLKEPPAKTGPLPPVFREETLRRHAEVVEMIKQVKQVDKKRRKGK